MKLRFRISMSLDGFVAGPRQSVADPLGVGGLRLHEWVFPLEIFRRMQGLEGGGEVDASTPVLEQAMAGIGATIMGRHMFGGGTGPWDLAHPWTGWWGPNPPYHHPVFVLTHHPRAPLVMEGGTTFHFITHGPLAALEAARQAAGGQDVDVAGGAHTAQQFLAAGLVDEMLISLVPVLLGGGERLFEGLGDDLHGLQPVETVVAPRVTHLRFVRG
jgi:dihydrofolate reductase